MTNSKKIFLLVLLITTFHPTGFAQAYEESVFHSLEEPIKDFKEEAKKVKEESISIAEPDIKTHAPTRTRTLNTRFGKTVEVPVILDEKGKDIYPLTRSGFDVYTAACSRIEFGETPWDEDVLRWVRHFVCKTPGRTKAVLTRYARWRPYIDRSMDAVGIPTELGYLCLVESGCTYNAVSPAGAVGMWQFMPETARDYGLTVNESTDERLDPVLLTQAAIHLLWNLYSKTGDWLLAAAAYNCGPGTVTRAVSKAGTNDWNAVRRWLPEETRQYIPSMLAFHFIWTYRYVLELE